MGDEDGLNIERDGSDSRLTVTNNSSLYQVNSYKQPKNNSIVWYIRDGNFEYNVMSGIVTVLPKDIEGEHDVSPLIETHGFHNMSFNNVYAEIRGVDTAKQTNDIMRELNVSNIAFTKSPDYNTFLSEGKPNYTNSSVNVGSTQYINWSVPLIYYFR